MWQQWQAPGLSHKGARGILGLLHQKELADKQDSKSGFAFTHLLQWVVILLQGFMFFNDVVLNFLLIVVSLLTQEVYFSCLDSSVFRGDLSFQKEINSLFKLIGYLLQPVFNGQSKDKFDIVQIIRIMSSVFLPPFLGQTCQPALQRALWGEKEMQKVLPSVFACT